MCPPDDDPSRDVASGATDPGEIFPEDVAGFLHEARATELAVLQLLAAQVIDTPPGRYRHDLQRHVREARRHIRLLEDRLDEIDDAGARATATVSPLRSWTAQVRAQARQVASAGAPSAGEPRAIDRMLEHVRDQCATAGLEIATYAALERVARTAGDARTAGLAAEIRAEEEHMLHSLLEHVGQLARNVGEYAEAPAPEP